MELLQRCKEITRLQSKLITEKKIIDSKLDSNIVQKFKLERRKFELIQKLQPPLPLPKVNVPPTPPTTPQSKNQAVTPPKKPSCTI